MTYLASRARNDRTVRAFLLAGREARAARSGAGPVTTFTNPGPTPALLFQGRTISQSLRRKHAPDLNLRNLPRFVPCSELLCQACDLDKLGSGVASAASS